MSESGTVIRGSVRSVAKYVPTASSTAVQKVKNAKCTVQIFLFEVAAETRWYGE